MPRAYALSILVCLAAAVPASARAAAEDPVAVRRIAEAGALETALARIDVSQPTDVISAAWAEWEGLRCDVLGRLHRRAQLLARVAALPSAAAAPSLNVCLVEASRASAQSEPGLSREYAARLLWQRNATPAEVRSARLAVVETYVAERRTDEAFRSMLRFQQDYQPLDAATAERFVDVLLDLDRDRDALNWLNRLDQTSAARLRLQLRSAALSPEAAIKQARAALTRQPHAAYWKVVYEAASRSRNASLQVEALEQVLQNVVIYDASAQREAAQRLWQAYAETATEIGNREQLLTGDDGTWADYAARRLGSDPFLSRAFYGYLAQRAQSADTRRNAQLQLTFSLSSAALDYTALRLWQGTGVDLQALDAQTRYLLGAMAARHNDAALAQKLWAGIPIPANTNAVEWHLTLARTALQAGDAQASVDAIRRILTGRPSVSPELAQSALVIAQEMLDLRKLDAAQAVYELLVPISSEARAREALFGLGRALELKGESAAAAAAYLRASLLAQNVAPDALTLQARLLAALNLMRAGLNADARSQFEWLVKNSKDPALIEAAKRGLSRL